VNHTLAATVAAAALALAAAAPAAAQSLYTETFEAAAASNAAYPVGTIAGTGMAVVNGYAWITSSDAQHGHVLDLGTGWYTSNVDPQTQIGSSTARSVATFDLLAGHTYTVSFDYSRQAWSAGNGPFSTALTASFGNHSVTYNDVAGFFYGLEWKAGLLSFTPAADELGVPLVLTAFGPPGYSGMVVDNISMVGLAPVPEPQAGALLLLGLAGLGLLGRWRGHGQGRPEAARIEG